MKTQPRSSRAQSSSSGYGSASSRTFTSPPEWATTHSSSRRQAAVRVGDHEYMRADAIEIMATPERTSNAIAPPRPLSQLRRGSPNDGGTCLAVTLALQSRDEHVRGTRFDHPSRVNPMEEDGT